MKQELMNLIFQKLRKGTSYQDLIDDLKDATNQLEMSAKFLEAMEEGKYAP